MYTLSPASSPSRPGTKSTSVATRGGVGGRRGPPPPPREPARPPAVHEGPAVRVPRDRCQESLAPEVVPVAGDGAEREEGHPPAAVGGLDEVGVAGALDRHVVLRLAGGEGRGPGGGLAGG